MNHNQDRMVLVEPFAGMAVHIFRDLAYTYEQMYHADSMKFDDPLFIQAHNDINRLLTCIAYPALGSIDAMYTRDEAVYGFVNHLSLQQVWNLLDKTCNSVLGTPCAHIFDKLAIVSSRDTAFYFAQNLVRFEANPRMHSIVEWVIEWTTNMVLNMLYWLPRCELAGGRHGWFLENMACQALSNVNTFLA
jgi:hypothetical protein